MSYIYFFKNHYLKYHYLKYSYLKYSFTLNTLITLNTLSKIYNKFYTLFFHKSIMQGKACKKTREGEKTR